MSAVETRLTAAQYLERDDLPRRSELLYGEVIANEQTLVSPLLPGFSLKIAELF
jgi:hypothetical protein